MYTKDNRKMSQFEGAHNGQVALVVLGGPSAANWQTVEKEVGADFLIGVNGVNRGIKTLDYWLCAENMKYPNQEAEKLVPRWVDIMEMYKITDAADWRFVNYKSAHLTIQSKNLIRIARTLEDDPYVHEVDLDEFTFRKYGGGLLNGPRMQRPEIVKDLRAGTVGLQAIHLAGLLGAKEIHTVGYDMVIPADSLHHWYQYPPYVGTRFYGENMFTEWKGVNTMWFWIDTVEYLKRIEPVLKRDGIIWKDHSNGLIQMEQLDAAN